MTVILVEDDADLRAACVQSLELEDIDVLAYSEAEPALDHLRRGFAGVCVSDVRLPGLSGLELARRCAAEDPDLPVILMTGHGDIAMAVKAIRDGAYDFIEKPFAPDRMVEAVRRGLEKRRLVIENRAYREQLSGARDIDASIIGNASATQDLKRMLLAAAAADADVLLFGETGTGKELAARALHDFGQRAGKPFVALNCGALPETVIESELFGHEAGAFTGAMKRRVGKFEHAHGGTVLLDEVESMPLALQIKLLRVLQERVVEPLGGNRQIAIDVRIVAATKTDLFEASKQGLFREDLFYRLNLVTVPIPPLRDRRADIPLLFEHFSSSAAAARKIEAPSPGADFMAALAAADWPGNVRELRNHAERFVLGLDLPPTAEQDDGADGTLPARMDAYEKSLIDSCLRETGGAITDACGRLGIGRKTLYDKMAKHGLRRQEYLSGSAG